MASEIEIETEKSQKNEEKDTGCNHVVPVMLTHSMILISKIVSEYNQEISQSQTADNPVAPRGRAAQPSRDTRKTN